jgi:hypothetical protein
LDHDQPFAVFSCREDGDVRLRLAMLFGGGPDAWETEVWSLEMVKFGGSLDK